MCETLLKWAKNAMHEHRISIQQKPTQNLWQNQKNPKIFPKIENLGKKCMNAWWKGKRRDQVHLLSERGLDKAENLMGRVILEREKEKFRSREEREIEIFEKWQNQIRP